MNAGAPIRRLASALGCTEGQAYTLVIGTLVTVVAVWLGVPPTLRERPAAAPTFGVTAPVPPVPVEPTPSSASAPTPVSPLAPVPITPATVAATAGPSPREPEPSASPTPAPRPFTRFGRASVAGRVGSPGAPDGVAARPDGGFVVATNNGFGRGEQGPSAVITYGPTGRPEREIAVAGQSSMRTSGLTGAVLDATGAAFVLDTAPARVLRVGVSGAVDVYAEIPDLPACGASGTQGCEPGTRNDAPLPRGIALDAAGGLYVTDAAQSLIWRVSTAPRVSPWMALDDTDAPSGVALDPQGSLVIAIGRPLGTAAAQPGAVVRVQVRPGPVPGRTSTLAETAPFDAPAGLAVAPAGDIVLSLQGANAVVLLSPSGRELARLDAARVDADTGVPLDGPTGVAIHRDRALVTNQSPRSNDSDHWTVFRLELA